MHYKALLIFFLNMNNQRLFLGLLAITTLLLGLWVRYSLWAYLPYYINVWIGDSLWSLMLYWAYLAIFGIQNPKKSAWQMAIFCIVVECSQLYQADWIMRIRATTLGGLAIGHGFLWSDLVAYVGGIVVGYWLYIYGIQGKNLYPKNR